LDKIVYFKICYNCFGQEDEYLFEWVILNDHLQSSQGSKQLDHIFSWFAWPVYFDYDWVFRQSNSTHGSSSISNRANTSAAATFQTYKHRLATYDTVRWLLLLFIYIVIQEIARITIAAVSWIWWYPSRYMEEHWFLIGKKVLAWVFALIPFHFCGRPAPCHGYMQAYPWRYVLFWLRWPEANSL
jgi:hypothetical protein